MCTASRALTFTAAAARWPLLLRFGPANWNILAQSQLPMAVFNLVNSETAVENFRKGHPRWLRAGNATLTLPSLI
jgi:hypothetical protein